MGSLCVLPGETQTVTIRSTPRYNKAFAVLWPDQEAHTEWGAWDYQATIGPDGTYTKAFLVPPTAPKGPARTDVSVSGISNNIGYQNQGHAFWEIATSC